MQNNSLFRHIAINHLNPDQAAQDLKTLTNEINHHNELYYGKDAPIINDSEYDALVQRHRAIEDRFPDLIIASSPRFKVGAKGKAGFKKVTHLFPMLSLDNGFNEEDIHQFFVP